MMMMMMMSRFIKHVINSPPTRSLGKPNRWAFRCPANVKGERVAVRRVSGRLFQVTGPATAKLLIPAWSLSWVQRVVRCRQTEGVDDDDGRFKVKSCFASGRTFWAWCNDVYVLKWLLYVSHHRRWKPLHHRLIQACQLHKNYWHRQRRQ